MSDRSSPEPVREIARRVESAGGSVIGLDFDGTLAPIREDPDAPSITAACRDAVADLASRPDTAVAVVSGRALSDLRDRVGIEGIVYAGNHGLELAAGDGAFVQQDAADSRTRLRRVAERIEDGIADVPGAQVEDKALTVTVHHRNTPDRRLPEVEEAVDDALDAVEGPLERQAGKEIVELRPAVDWDKGSAMEWLAGRYPDDWHAVYVGDDTTDEDVFETLGPDDVGVHVGDGETAAPFRIAERDDVAPFLSWLAGLFGEGREHGEGSDDSADGSDRRPRVTYADAGGDVTTPRRSSR